MTRCWVLQDARQSLVLAAKGDHLPEIVYWGPRLPDGEDPETVASAGRLDVTGGMLDQNPDLSICPAAADSFPGQPGLGLRDGDGLSVFPKFRFGSADQQENALTLSYHDQTHGLTYRAVFELNPRTHMITARSEVAANAPVHLDWLAAPVFPGPQHSDEMLDFSGRWCDEFQVNRTPWSAGIRLREGRTGRSGHEHFPGLIVPCSGASNTRGQAYAFHYGWSGGHRMVAEELQDGRRQIQFGNATGTELSPQTRFSSATLYATFSDEGLNGCATAFQRHLRDEVLRLPDPARPRPVHYNCWEAVYFDHDMAELQDIASRAAALGAERFVLDDGWFGKRDDDTSSLADWEVDRRKYPDGLGPLVDHVQALGMSFGIWFEPEMINPDSDTYRSHPEWALGEEDQILGRQQKVLNMALPEVRDFLFDKVGAVLSEYDIDYVKWDHNRVLPMPDAAQTRGTYALIDRLRAAFPKVEIESCASGGGRIDFGILERTTRVWLSDSNDALQRLRIQHDAALFLPSVVTGSHVGPRRSHTSGRVIDMKTRAWVAAQRHMGFEMDPRELTEAEAQTLAEVTAWWKANRDWMARADILRLDSPDPSVTAEQQLSEQRDRFVVFAGVVKESLQTLPRPLRLTRLDADATYRVDLINRDDAPERSRLTATLAKEPLQLSGQYLMNHGLVLPWQFPHRVWVIEGARL